METKNLFDLIEGYRFYFLSDRRRHVWQVDWIEEKEKVNIFGKTETYQVYNLIDDAKLKKQQKLNEKVNFTRNNETPSKT